MIKKDYNKLAQAVRCPQCDAVPGEPCRGSTGHVAYTHHGRRAKAGEPTLQSTGKKSK